ncbi:unnamed protein product [Ambrosiozyma monospora]|uniref:Unnamed protein product n=1 Tax=Ambrosiozyma monospora TaxID=43982 RepID=A0ACB5T921_AMBMO|nr:unnamed protein product [Ambrosiozyma monospora]
MPLISELCFLPPPFQLLCLVLSIPLTGPMLHNPDPDIQRVGKLGAITTSLIGVAFILAILGTLVTSFQCHIFITVFAFASFAVSLVHYVLFLKSKKNEIFYSYDFYTSIAGWKSDVLLPISITLFLMFLLHLYIFKKALAKPISKAPADNKLLFGLTLPGFIIQTVSFFFSIVPVSIERTLLSIAVIWVSIFSLFFGILFFVHRTSKLMGLMSCVTTFLAMGSAAACAGESINRAKPAVFAFSIVVAILSTVSFGFSFCSFDLLLTHTGEGGAISLSTEDTDSPAENENSPAEDTSAPAEEASSPSPAEDTAPAEEAPPVEEAAPADKPAEEAAK